MSEPGRRIVLRTVPKDVSRTCIGSDLARAHTHTLTSSASAVVDRQRATSILAAGLVRHQDKLEVQPRAVRRSFSIVGFLGAIVLPQVLFTCSKCGNEWTVPRYWTKRHSRGTGTSPAMALGGDAQLQMMGGVTRQHINESSASAGEAAQTRSGYSTCAKCGSNLHTKKRLWSIQIR